jgi:type 1 glutamine amidotransferase
VGVHALIASGSGRYGDPWHSYARTSGLIAEALTDAGFTVDLDDDVDHALANLEHHDLLVVNAGDPWRGDDMMRRPPAAAIDGFAGALARGVGVLGMHSSVASLRDYPEWAEAIGAVWIPEVSSHPPADVASILVDAEFAGDGPAAFEVFDERYCDLQFIGRSRVVAHHRRDDESLPTAWVRELGAARIACDLLGHDEHSYESEGHRALIARLARWAATPRPIRPADVRLASDPL